MTDIVDPGSINNGDTPDWDAVQAYFDAIYSVVNSPGQLDDDNIKSGAGIAYSKLDLDGAIQGSDLAVEAVTYDKIATPNLTTVTSSAIADGGIIATTPTQTLTTNAPSAGFYLIIVHAEAFNAYHSTTVGARLTSTLKIGGAANQNLHRDWFMTTVDPDLYANFTHVVPAVLSNGQAVSHEFTDNLTSHTQVANGGVRLYLVRIAAS